MKTGFIALRFFTEDSIHAPQALLTVMSPKSIRRLLTSPAETISIFCLQSDAIPQSTGRRAIHPPKGVLRFEQGFAHARCFPPIIHTGRRKTLSLTPLAL